MVYSSSWKAHLQHLEVVLKLLKHHQLYAKLSKCSFGQQQIEYLGHTVSGAGIQMDANKVQVVIDWPTPTNLKQLRVFFRLTGFYRQFIKGYATLASPLTDFLKKGQFRLGRQSHNCIQPVKKMLSQLLLCCPYHIFLNLLLW